MNIAVSNSWYKANFHYLITASVAVHRALERHIAIKQNQPSEVVLEDETDLTAIASSMSTPPALEQLCTTFNLSPFERNILLMCVGIALLPNASSLYANAQGNREMPYPTFGLALEVFPEAHWSAFTPQSPLRHWQLLQVGTGQVITLCPLQIDESVLHYLLGEPYQDQRLSNAIASMQVESYHQTPLQPSHQKLVDRIVATWSQSNPEAAVSIVQLCGTEAADKWAIAANASHLIGRPIKMMFAHRLPSQPDELHVLMQRWEREVALTNSLLLLDCERLNLSDTQLQTTILQLIQTITTPLIITTQERLHSPERPLMTYDVPKLTHSEQLAMWNANLGTAAAEMNGQVEALASQFNLSTPTIVAACLKVKEENSASSIQNQLWDICRTMARPRLDDLAQRIESTAVWEDLVLPEQQRQTIRDISAHVRQRAKVYESWGFAGKGGRGLGISALFSGASGTGKTMAAEVIAQELHLDLYRIDLSAVVSKYIGETEKNLRRIFDAAETGGAILLFDEADALFGKRSEVKDSHDRHANVEVSYLLQRMEAYQGLAILTTNLKGSLDQAFLRRIRFVVPFSFPDAKARSEIWMRIFPSRTPTQGLDTDKLGKLNVAGGNIRNIALNAAFLAADTGEAVMMKHILQAAKSEYLKLERSLTEAEIKGWV